MHLISRPRPPPQPPLILHNLWIFISSGITTVLRETENNAYKIFFFWGGGEGCWGGAAFTQTISPSQKMLFPRRESNPGRISVKAPIILTMHETT